MTATGDRQQDEILQERESLLDKVQRGLEVPMLFLGVVWLALFAVEMAGELTPLLEGVGYLIWGLFILEFLVRLILSSHKWEFVRNNWLSVISLVAPAFRVLRIISLLKAARIARAAGVVRGLRMLRLLTTVNRGMSALGATMKRRGAGYVVLVTVMVTVAGAAAMYSFEHESGNRQGLDTYGTALWWTAMIMTTMGSQYWPQSPEGRILCFLLSLYGFSVFGYVTATLATFFIGRDAANEEAEVASAKAIARLQEDVEVVGAELRSLRLRLEGKEERTQEKQE